jgi:hypothetical protein
MTSMPQECKVDMLDIMEPTGISQVLMVHHEKILNFIQALF